MRDVGDRIPDLPLQLTGGDVATLAGYAAGKWLVLYFYPKDSTPGCTTEGNDFNALLPAFKRAGAKVLGVSRDSLKAHANFIAKQGFGFDLHSDAGWQELKDSVHISAQQLFAATPVRRRRAPPRSAQGRRSP